MARKITRKSMKQDEFVEAAFDAGEWIENNWQLVAMGVAGLVVVGGLGWGWVAWSASRARATEEVFSEGYDLYRSATADGGGNAAEELSAAAAHFEDAAARAGSKPLGGVARLYEGLASLDGGNAAQAIATFEEVVEGASNPVIRSTAQANLAQALAVGGELERAIAVWTELSAAEPAYYPPDQAVLSIAKLQIREGRSAAAAETLRGLIDEYPQGRSLEEARTLLDGLPGQAPGAQ